MAPFALAGLAWLNGFQQIRSYNATEEPPAKVNGLEIRDPSSMYSSFPAFNLTRSPSKTTLSAVLIWTFMAWLESTPIVISPVPVVRLALPVPAEMSVNVTAPPNDWSADMFEAVEPYLYLNPLLAWSVLNCITFTLTTEAPVSFSLVNDTF